MSGIRPMQTIDIGFTNGLTGWNFWENGGSAHGKGSVTAGSAILREGDSFLVTLDQDLIIPQAPLILSFTYEATFDTSDPDSINDAFEAVLTTADGSPLVFNFAPDRDAFFNLTEQMPSALGTGTTEEVVVDGNRVSTDISQFLPGTHATLMFRLVNNDSDVDTTIHILDVHITSGDDAPPVATVGLANDTAPDGPGSDPYRSDLLTNDPRVSGIATDDHAIALLQLQLDNGSFVDITSSLVDGRYTYDPGNIAPGLHRITVRATDSLSQTTESAVDFTVNLPPVANAGGHRTVNEGDTVTFSGSGSSDADGSLFSYHWGFEDGSSVTDIISSQAYPQDGVFPVSLTVTDTAGSVANDVIEVTVSNVAPTVLTATGLSGEIGDMLDFTATFSDPGVFDTHRALVHWGDGAVSEGTVTEGAGQGSIWATHAYAMGGTYTIRVEVADDAGDSSDRLATADVTGGETSSIAGYVYLDVNNNGIKDPPEKALPNVPIAISGNVSWTVLTGADGSYRFDDLPPGAYAITETQPHAFLDGRDTQGSPRLGSVANDWFHGIELPATMHATDYNFGEIGLRAELLGKHLFLASTPTAEEMMVQLMVPGGRWFAFQASDTGLLTTSIPPEVHAPVIEVYTGGMMPVTLSEGEHEASTPIEKGATYVLYVAGQVASAEFATTLQLDVSGSAGTSPTRPRYYINPLNALDATGDGVVSPLDALVVINALNRRGEVDTDAGLLFLDITGDTLLSPRDALWVINYLNTSSSGSGEGEDDDAAEVDLVIGDLDTSEVIYDGQSLTVSGTISATVRNDGPDAVDDSFSVLFFEDRNLNGKYDASLDGVLGRAEISQPLLSDQDITIIAQMSARVAFSGNAVWACADSGGAIAESDEQNNIARTSERIAPRPGQFNPVVEWSKSVFSVQAESNQVYMTPAVIDLNGDNTPDIVFSTFSPISWGQPTLRAISGADGAELWDTTDAPNGIESGSGIAVGDIDRDGLPEIVVLNTSGGLSAFENDGRFKWSSPAVWGGNAYGAPSITELNADNEPEIVIGATVLNSDGSIRWQGDAVGGQGRGANSSYGLFSAVADLDLDGSPEVVAGKSAYGAQGSLLWNSLIPDGFPAIGNFDGDAFPEIAVVASGNVYLLEHTGAMKWGPIAIPGGGSGGPPTIADMDGDGEPEIGVAGANRYVVLNSDGSIAWTNVTRDESSAMTGSSVFDFDGDGSAEVVYGDELYLRIYRGSDGEVLYQLPKGSGTLFEYPVIADVDADGNAEIVAVANDYAFGHETGIYVIGDANDTWVPTRQIWNQHTYHVTNVNDDGTIPVREENSWQAHNTYRLNLQGDIGDPIPAPDLTASYLRVAPSGSGATFTARIGNGGSILVGPNMAHAFFDGDPEQGGTLMGVARTTKRLEPGQFQDISLTVSTLPLHDVWIVADDDGTGIGVESESDETNNAHHAQVNFVAPTVTIAAPVDASELPPGQQILASGQAIAATSLGSVRATLINRIVSVSVNGQPVDALDASGNFFTKTTILPGENVFVVIATDAFGQSATETVTVTGTQESEDISENVLFDVSPSFEAEYARTSFDERTNLLYAQLVIRNVGQYGADNPFLVGIRNISDASVRVRQAAGFTQDGMPYYNFSPLVSGNTLAPGDITGFVDAVFYNPDRVPFTYELVFLAKLNGSPAFTTVPKTETIVDRAYTYDADAIDPDGDSLAYSLVTGPADMHVHPATGVITWMPPAGQLGSFDVSVRAADGRGGSAEQRYVLSVIDTPPNRPPFFTSVPVADVLLNVPYSYDADAVDPDSDTLAYTLLVQPQGMLIDGATGVLSWRPTRLQVGTHDVTISVTDGHGGSTTQSFLVQVQPDPSNHPPVILSDPVTTAFPVSLAEREVIEYEGEWRYKVVSFGELDGFEVPDFDDSAFSVGRGGFGSDGSCAGCALNLTARRTSWPLNTDILLRRSITLPAGAALLTVRGAIDNDIQIYVNGVDISQGISTHEGCAEYNEFSVMAADSLLRVGENVIAVRARDRGCESYVDVTISAELPEGWSSEDPSGGDTYEYNVISLDPDDDPLSFSLAEAPTGMTIDANTGRVTWGPPATSVGQSFPVTVRVDDGRGGFDEQSFVIDVRQEDNYPPAIVSEPGPAFSGHPYTYDVDAVDPDNDPLTYSLFNTTVPLTIDPITGVISWPDADLNPKFEWAMTAGSGGYEYAGDVKLDTYGNVYVAGVFNGTVDFDTGPAEVNLTSAGGSDAFIAKYSPARELMWAKSLGGAGEDWAHGEFVDSEGSVYIAGHFQQTADFDPGPGSVTLTATGSIDAFLLKLDSSGTLVWARSAGGTGIDLTTDVTVDSNGDVYAVGYFQATVDFDPGTPVQNVTNLGTMSAFVWSLDQAGELRWIQRISGGMEHELAGFGNDFNITADKANNVIISGYFRDGVDFETDAGTTHLTSAGARDVVVAKFNSSEVFIWADRIGGADDDLNGQVTTDSVGNVYLAGFFAGQVDVDPGPDTYWLTSEGFSDAFIVKLDEAGNFVWARRSGGAGGEEAQGIASDRWGNIYASTTNALLKLDSQGNLIWTLPAADGFLGIDCRGTIYLGGTFGETADLDPTTETWPVTSKGDYDLYLAKFTQAGGNVRVDDGRGGFDTQCFMIDVRPYQPAEIRGHTFNDLNGDGIRDAGEGGTADVTVYLDQNHNDRRDAGEPFTMTDVDGKYSFAGLAPGTYFVAEERRTAWMPTTVGAVTVPGPLYAIGNGVDDNSSNLYRIDNYATVPEAINRGETGRILLDLAVDPITGLAYATDSTRLIVVDLETGATTVVGEMGVNSQNALAFTPDGTLYSWGHLDSHLYRVNLHTGVATAVLDTGFYSGGDLAYGGGSTLFGTTGSELIEIDIASRTSALVGAHHVDAIFGLDIDKSGTMYGSGGSDIDGRSILYRIDRTSGVASLVGTIDGATSFGNYGLSFDRIQFQPVVGSHEYEISLVAGEIVTKVDFGDKWTGIADENRHPVFLSSAPFEAVPGQLLRYDADATDPDGDPLAFDLAVKPAGMAMDPMTGVVVWVPTADQLGAHDVVLRVQDGRGGVDLQSFQITVSRANSAPVITSQPKGPAIVNVPYQYQVHAQDADGNTITYRLDTYPVGMQIAIHSGLVTWIPTSDQVGEQTVAITVTDSHGAGTTQSFHLPVVATAPNDPPQIDSQPRGTIRVGDTYLYQVLASDPNGDVLTYNLTQLPTGMSISQSGLMEWKPTAVQMGLNAVEITVDDGRGGTAVQGFSVNVVTQTTNRAPAIVSNPPVAATVGRSYEYDPKAVDPDGDPLAWSLDVAPAGMSISATTGALRWTPGSSDPGAQEVVIRVMDTQGSWATQSYTLTVRSVNVPPNITSVPPTEANVGETYLYAVRATDPEDDSLSFSLTTTPTGMTIDSQTGTITWTPVASQAGSRDVVVRVDDGQGGSATQKCTVVVSSGTTNQPPIITSSPLMTATTGELYQYAVSASDAEGDTLLFSLLASPDGMVIDAVTGLVQWTPSSTQIGAQAVTVAAIDPAGAGGTQSFTIVVADDNQSPQVTSSPVQVVTAGLAYRYDVRATDPDGDPIRFSLAGPSGMIIDALGRVDWNPQIADIGTHRIEITATDSHGLWIRQDYDLIVLADSQTPRVNLFVSNNPVEINNLVTLAVSATDNVQVTAVGLTINGTPVALDSQGRVTLLASPVGQYSIVASAWDVAGNTGLASTVLTVRDTSDVEAPVVDLISPANGAVISSAVDVIGTVQDANLLYYTLSVARDGGGLFTEIFRGTNAVTNGVLGQFDPSGLANDSYVLRLEAVDSGGNVSYIDQTVNVAGDLKLGNFTLSFNDLSIPVSGIPITVARTYDSLNADQQDGLGYGWRLEFRDTNLQTNVEPTGMEEYGFYSPFSSQTQVYVTLPGGRRERFTFSPTRMSGFGGIFFMRPAFSAQPGSTSTLSVPITNSTVLLAGDDGSYYNAAGLPYNPADKENFDGIYYLTTKEGIRYEIDAQSGDMTQITDPNRNTLTFTDTSIDSSTGQRIVFERDPRGRITAAIDPTGAKVRYEYDAEGDLVGVTDREGNRTHFLYEAARAHYLTTITDPLGRTGVRSEYDAQGRLVKLIDAAGKAVELIHDPNNSLETVKDALGNATTFEYDERGNVVTEINSLSGTTIRTYDAHNNVLSETDPLGRINTYTYDGAGNLLTETDPLGRVTRYTYGPYGRLLTSTDPLGNTTTNTYDGAGNVLTTVDALNNVTRYTYDSRGSQTSITDAAGKKTQFEYDGVGNMTRQVDALGNATTFSYDASGNQLSQTTTVTTPTGPRTLVTTTQYDGNGRPVKVTDAEGHSTLTEYDALGNQTATVDSLGRRTDFRYDDRGQLITTQFADGTATTSSYDDAGRRITSTDRAGRTSIFHYDALGRLTETVYPDDTPADSSDNPRTKTEYDQAGQVVAQIDERGNRTEFEYDAAGRQKTVRDALGHETVMTYDTAGRQVASTDALGRITQFVYDSLGRQTQTRLADGTSTQTQYDALGRSVVQTDQAGRVTHFEYDALGRLIAVIDALNQRTEYGYDEAGNLITQQDANGHITRYEYDGVGRRIATVLPLGQRSTAVYDDVGNVASTTDFNGDTVTFQYDTNNRLLEKDFPDGTSVAFTYFATGQRQSVTDARGTTNYTYDARDRLLSRTDPDGRSIAYTYDAAGNRTSVTSPAGTIAYSFDTLNRLASVTDPEGSATSYTYDAVGALVQTQFPNGTTETREYDSLNRLLLLENEDPSGVISSYRYTLDPTGNRTRVVEHDGRAVDYSYDEIYRLIGESISDSTAGNRSINYTYDPVGNRLSRDDSAEGATAYTYDENDRLLTEVAGAVTTTYEYDDNGNTLSRTSATDQVFYDWDFENRLMAADTDGDGTNDVAYRYDADGTRVSSTSGSEETRFLIDTSQPYTQVLEEYTPGGVIKVSYVHGLDLISQNRPNDTGKSFYHVDGLGSTRALTNASGLVTDRYVYDAFGRTIGQFGSTGNVYLFAGEQRDLATGLDYLRARWMNTATGRFASRDILESVDIIGDSMPVSPVALHKYAYANTNPLTNIDPSGNFAIIAAAILLSQPIFWQSSIFNGFRALVDSVRDTIMTARLKRQIEAGKIIFDAGNETVVKQQLLRQNAGTQVTRSLQELVLELSSLVSTHVRISSLIRTGSFHSQGRAVDIGNESIAASLLPLVATDEQVAALDIDELIFDAAVAGQSDRNMWNYDQGQRHNYGAGVLGDHDDHIHVAVKR
ncbi:MAG: putative Ig domain-containing protein [Pirellulaceae bacterium]